MANDEYRTPQQAARDAGLAARHETRVERAIRRQVAEEIAQAIEDEANWRFILGERRARYDSARIAREVGSQEGSE